MWFTQLLQNGVAQSVKMHPSVQLCQVSKMTIKSFIPELIDFNNHDSYIFNYSSKLDFALNTLCVLRI